MNKYMNISTLVHFGTTFHSVSYKINNKQFDSIFSPRRELWLTPGTGMGGAHKSQKSQRKHLFLYLSPRKETSTDARDGEGGHKKKERSKNHMFINIFYIILFISYICIFYIIYRMFTFHISNIFVIYIFW